jgi:hypothetical protein
MDQTKQKQVKTLKSERNEQPIFNGLLLQPPSSAGTWPFLNTFCFTSIISRHVRVVQFEFETVGAKIHFGGR